MFSVVLLLNINFAILRSVRNTLAVADIGGGAHSIPLYELFGALPGAILLTWGLGVLMNRLSMHRVFFIAISLFIGFFLLFACCLYPSLIHWREGVAAQGGISEIKVANFVLTTSSLVFYVMAELWKTALMIILFWGLVNRYVPLIEAKRLYAPLMLGASIGTMLAGPLVSFCTASWNFYPLSSEPWTHSLIAMMVILAVFGILLAYLYYKLWHFFSTLSPIAEVRGKEKFSLKEDIALCIRNPQLLLLSGIVIADYIAYSLGEVIFLDILKKKYTNPCAYCNFMGQLSTWSGVCTLLCALFVNPFIMRRCRWVVGALVTPVCLLLLEGLFFIVIQFEGMKTWFGWNQSDWLGAAIFLGVLQYCICKAAKYTLFDSSKELAFVMLPEGERMRGKLVVDGICARLGRGSASLITISLITMCGGVIASSLIAGIIAMGMGAAWFASTTRLGKLIDGVTVNTLEKS